MSIVTFKVDIKANNFRSIKGAVIEDIASAMYTEAELIMTDSKANYVPVVTGQLSNSGTVLKPEIKPSSVIVKLGYGGPAAPYALAVHEAPPSWGQHKPKYLSRPLNKASTGLTTRIANAVRTSLRAKGVVK